MAPRPGGGEGSIQGPAVPTPSPGSLSSENKPPWAQRPRDDTSQVKGRGAEQGDLQLLQPSPTWLMWPEDQVCPPVGSAVSDGSAYPPRSSWRRQDSLSAGGIRRLHVLARTVSSDGQTLATLMAVGVTAFS